MLSGPTVTPGRRIERALTKELSSIRIVPNRPSTLLGMAYDRPVVGFRAPCANTLRLWGAAAPETLFALSALDDTGPRLARTVQ